MANTSFVAGGIGTAGPFPVGIALWPRTSDPTTPDYGDTIVVANSGGTELSVIDVRPTARRLVWRQDLPNFLIETYRVVQSGGFFRVEIIVYDVSDRPQYVGTVCRPAGGPCAKDSIFALYSTTPTLSSASPFSGRATLRMEKLRNPAEFAYNPDSLFGHLFWEIAGDSTLSSLSRDTLRIELRRGRPYNRQSVVLSACAGVTIEIARFGLGDQTFVRNSGDFTHAFFGEGGNISTQFARVMNYSARGLLRQGAATSLGPCPTSGFTSDSGYNDVDTGMSPAIDVSDFISNTGVKIVSIATNKNGGTNLVRADSVYVLDEGLRLKGTACPLTPSGSACVQGADGMDMNYNHDFAAGSPGTTAFGFAGDSTNRVMFIARPDGNIDVFDTFFYGKIASIPIRDPIVGPLRVAKDALGNQLLFGVTSKGLVMVQLPSIPNPFPLRASSRAP